MCSSDLAAGVSQAIVFHGYVNQDDLPPWYRAADVFVLSSDFDNSPNVVLEAMASGVPVIVSNEGGPKFLVQSNKNGYIADSFESFVEALMDLRTHSHQRQILSDGARATAMTFSWDSVFEGVYASYGSLLRPAIGALPGSRPDPRRLIRI